MTFFWSVATLLAVAVMLVVLLPLWRVPARDERSLVALNKRVYQERLAELESDRAQSRIDAATFEELHAELDRALLQVAPSASAPAQGTHWKWPLLLALVMSVAALVFYASLHFRPEIPAAWALQKAVTPAARDLLAGREPAGSDRNAYTLPDMIRGLQWNLQRKPEQPEGWFTLGVAYAQLNLPEPALIAFERAWRQKPDDMRYALSLAQTRMFSNQGQLDAKSQRLLEQVLAKMPEHEGALLLLGLGAYRSKQYALAVPALEKLVVVRAQRHPSDKSAAMQEVQRALLASRAHLSGAVPAITPARLQVKVVLDRALAGKVGPDDVLFVFARALQGPPMPLAVVRRPASTLPLTVTLGDADSLLPQRLLSSVPEISVSARISRKGTAEPASGDLEAVPVPVRQGEEMATVELRINTVR
ncbi:MAG: c-type cytochrome biogenesis protein CcmI, partial [Moraxellaceae bacterium]